MGFYRTLTQRGSWQPAQGLYGRAGRLRELDDRKSGAAGAQARAAAVREQDQIEREEAQSDPDADATA